MRQMRSALKVANMRVGLSGDSSTAASIEWLRPPVRLLPDGGGPPVVGVGPPLSRKARRRWLQMAAEQAQQEPEAA
jgi:hypothetical protein